MHTPTFPCATVPNPADENPVNCCREAGGTDPTVAGVLTAHGGDPGGDVFVDGPGAGDERVVPAGAAGRRGAAPVLRRAVPRGRGGLPVLRAAERPHQPAVGGAHPGRLRL